MSRQVDLVCFGELLWDVFPDRKVAGGAPFNIVNRATALGLQAYLISAVGNDDLGVQLVDIVGQKGNATQYIQTHPSYATSTVEIVVSDEGEPSYTFPQPVAWDDITISQALIDLSKSCRAFVYSSLALRDERSRKRLFELLGHATMKVCDINLRDGQYHRSTIEEMLRHADILRMNEFELNQTSKWLTLDYESVTDQLKALADIYEYDTVIVTLGPEGAISIRNGVIYEQPVFKVEVQDTVGSGDAFLAAYIYGRLADKEESEVLRYACAVGAVTASKAGGTPVISSDEIDILLT